MSAAGISGQLSRRCRTASRVQLLKQAGLKHVGCFRLDPSSGRPVLDVRKNVHVPPKPGLYAFLKRGQLAYLGVSGGISGRIASYTQAGNADRGKVIAGIKLALKHGDRVTVWTLELPYTTFRGLPMSRAHGIEVALIAARKPMWNSSAPFMRQELRAAWRGE